MRFIYQQVDRIPEELQLGVVYHNQEFELAQLLCACGCGHRVTLLVPDGHQVISEGELATIRPSIAVLDSACKSHYFITAGNVIWLESFSNSAAKSVMKSQIARHASKDKRPRNWKDKIWTATQVLLARAKSFFKR